MVKKDLMTYSSSNTKKDEEKQIGIFYFKLKNKTEL